MGTSTRGQPHHRLNADIWAEYWPFFREKMYSKAASGKQRDFTKRAILRRNIRQQ